VSAARRAEAVLFDFGGVLTTPVWDSFEAFCRAEGLEPDSIRALFRDDPEALADLRGLERGDLSEREFELSLAGRLGLGRSEGIIERLFEGMVPLEEMLAAVRSLRVGGLRTGLVSNSWSTDHYDRALLAEHFDAVLISGELGMHKPQPEIYLLAAERVGAAPADCVFVDDLRENCAGAEAVGMVAIRHREPAETIERLAALTGIGLAGRPSGGA
jgi:epoxide hydrolase-like predicted phosphatase